MQYCTTAETEVSLSAAQRRAARYAFSLTDTVMFGMVSPFHGGGAARSLCQDCASREGNYLQYRQGLVLSPPFAQKNGPRTGHPAVYRNEFRWEATFRKASSSDP